MSYQLVVDRRLVNYMYIYVYIYIYTHTHKYCKDTPTPPTHLLKLSPSLLYLVLSGARVMEVRLKSRRQVRMRGKLKY